MIYFTCDCGLLADHLTIIGYNYRPTKAQLKQRPWVIGDYQNQILECPRCGRVSNWFTLRMNNSEFIYPTQWYTYWN